MRKTLLMAAAAIVLSSVAVMPLMASAGPTPAELKRDGEIKNPAQADAAIAKDEAKDARTQAHRAHKKAKVAHRKAKLASKRADQAGGAVNPAP